MQNLAKFIPVESEIHSEDKKKSVIKLNFFIIKSKKYFHFLNFSLRDIF